MCEIFSLTEVNSWAGLMSLTLKCRYKKSTLSLFLHQPPRELVRCIDLWGSDFIDHLWTEWIELYFSRNLFLFLSFVSITGKSVKKVYRKRETEKGRKKKERKDVMFLQLLGCWTSVDYKMLRLCFLSRNKLLWSITAIFCCCLKF